MPNERRARQEACLSSEDERTPPHKHEAGGAILESIHEKLKKLDVFEQINGRLLTIENTVGDLERGLNSMTAELQKVKTDLDSKADNATVETLKDEIEELQNMSRRNNLVFYNIPEEAEKEIASPLYRILLRSIWALKRYVAMLSWSGHTARQAKRLLLMKSAPDQYLSLSFDTRIR